MRFLLVSFVAALSGVVPIACTAVAEVSVSSSVSNLEQALVHAKCHWANR